MSLSTVCNTCFSQLVFLFPLLYFMILAMQVFLQLHALKPLEHTAAGPGTRDHALV